MVPSGYAGAVPDGGEVGVFSARCKQDASLGSKCRDGGGLAFYNVFHACQIRKDVEVVLGAPALLHAGISRSAAGTTPRGVPGWSGAIRRSWIATSPRLLAYNFERGRV